MRHVGFVSDRSLFIMSSCQFSQFNLSVMSDTSWPHGPQHARPPCPSPTPGVYSNSYSLSQWCYPTISSSVILFSFCLRSFPASGFFFFQWVDSSHQVAKVLELQLQHQFFQYSGLISFRIAGLISFAIQGTLKSPSAPQFESFNSLALSLLYGHPYMTTRKGRKKGRIES